MNKQVLIYKIIFMPIIMNKITYLFFFKLSHFIILSFCSQSSESVRPSLNSCFRFSLQFLFFFQALFGFSGHPYFELLSNTSEIIDCHYCHVFRILILLCLLKMSLVCWIITKKIFLRLCTGNIWS
jgi:hypothetical protein